MRYPQSNMLTGWTKRVTSCFVDFSEDLKKTIQMAVQSICYWFIFVAVCLSIERGAFLLKYECNLSNTTLLFILPFTRIQNIDMLNDRHFSIYWFLLFLNDSSTFTLFSCEIEYCIVVFNESQTHYQWRGFHVLIWFFSFIAMDQAVCIECSWNKYGSDKCNSVGNALSGQISDVIEINCMNSNRFTNILLKIRCHIIIRGQSRMHWVKWLQRIMFWTQILLQQVCFSRLYT